MILEYEKIVETLRLSDQTLMSILIVLVASTSLWLGLLIFGFFTRRQNLKAQGIDKE